jgi:hypothetical protein
MRNSHKLITAGIAACALAVTPVAVGADGATATATPKRAKEGKTVEMLVRGMRPNERVKAVESAPFGQTRTLYPRAGAGGSLLVRVKAQVKGKHTWKFKGRRSKRTASTTYRVV